MQTFTSTDLKIDVDDDKVIYFTLTYTTFKNQLESQYTRNFLDYSCHFMKRTNVYIQFLMRNRVC